MSEIRLADRDYRVMKEIDRWRVCQGRHIRILVGFDGQRACDRRLRKLMEAGYIKREKILYGVAGLYSNTGKAKQLIELLNVNQKVRVEQIKHDIAVLDTSIWFHQEQGIAFSDITTEIELHRQDGFGVRKHRPDFVFTKGTQTVCVEVELSLKSRTRLEANIKANFLKYDEQIWIVPSISSKIACILEGYKTQYTNIRIIELSEVQNIE